LHWAPYSGHMKTVQFLVERSADPTVRDKDGCTPLHRASQNGHVEVARFLVEQGTDLAVQDKGGWTPLHAASQNGHDEIVQFLVKRGADIRVQNDNGIMPVALFHSVPGNGHSQVVQPQPNLRHSDVQTEVAGLRGIWCRTMGVWKSRFSLSSHVLDDSSSRVSQM